MLTKGELEATLERCKTLLRRSAFLIDAPLVSFFKDRQWEYVESLGWADYLLGLSDEELALLPDASVFPLAGYPPQSLIEFVAECRNLSTTFPDYIAREGAAGFVKLGMSPKKQHEVSRMCDMVRESGERFPDLHQVVDFGSGKGYLPEYLALTSPDLTVVGLDREEVNTRGGEQRNCLMNRMWGGLFRKHNPGREPPEKLNHYHPITMELTSQHVSPDFVQLVAEEASKGCVSVSEGCISGEKETMLLGLHACGDLTSLLLHTFLTCPALRSIVSVGCCYHIITQRQRTPAYMTQGTHTESLSSPDSVHAYPMSRFLQGDPVYFTRNALTLAQQAPEKSASAGTLPPKNLFFRAVFQVLLYDLFEGPGALNVGQAASNAPDCVSYTRAALRKLELDTNPADQITDSCISQFYRKYSETHEREVYLFHQLRTLLARVIESVILIDRLLYLHDNGVEAQIYRLFDPIISPRCFVIVANKAVAQAQGSSIQIL